MKRIGLLFMSVLFLSLLFSCTDDYYHAPDGKVYDNYNAYIDHEMSTRPKPIVLMGVHKSGWGASITIKDGAGSVLAIGNFSTFAVTIGDSRNVGDTLIK